MRSVGRSSTRSCAGSRERVTSCVTSQWLVRADARMALLVLDRVSKRFARGDAHGRDHDVLCDVSLELDVGEVVGVVGRRRSGRTTLLEVAAGVEAPSEGSV